MKRYFASFAPVMTVLALAVGMPEPVRANIMNFEGLPSGSILSSGLSQDGIQLSLISGHYDIWACGVIVLCPATNGNVAGLDILSRPGPPSVVRISLVDGNSFNLDSIEIVAALHAPGELSFMRACDGRTFFFNNPGQFAGFDGIQYFDISSEVSVAGAFLFDNIIVTSIPEPSTSLTALGALIFGMTLIRRRF